MILGIDIGTSSLKTLVIDEKGNILAKSSKRYDILEKDSQHGGEQNPEDWVEAAIFTIRKVVGKLGGSFQGLSFSGQTHGIVCLDNNKNILRPAIIWTDRRGDSVIPKIEKILGCGRFTSITQNQAFSGYGIVSLFWLKEKEPNVFHKIAYLMSPKDYVRYRITDEIGMDFSDATGLACLDVTTKTFATGMLSELGINPDIFPKELGESSDFAGKVSERFSKLTNLNKDIPVFYGGADTCMQSIGNGVIDSNTLTINIGSAGQVATVIDRPINAQNFRTTLLCCGIPHKWQIYGATLSAGLSLKWLNQNILQQGSYDDINELVNNALPISDELFFLPYLVGERTPHMSSRVKAIFWGLTLGHDVSHLVRAVMEGVCFSFRECYDVLKEIGIKPTRVVAAGGGAKSHVWMQILSDVLQMDIYQNSRHEEACLGACIMAAVGAGLYGGCEEAIANIVKYSDKIYQPTLEHKHKYSEMFIMYKEIYRANKNLFV